MKFRLTVVSLLAALAGAFALTATPVQATAVNDNPCGVQGWYVNPDETDDAPTRSVDGFFFDNKDLIHHATAPIDLPDIKILTGSFEADTAGKVVFKMETENPYSTIIQNPDASFWSTAMTYDQIGGQGHPVVSVSDLIGKDTKPGKVKYGDTTHVVTFGVGYWVADGNTTVSSITFHGTTYDLTCKPKPTESTSPTATPTKTSPSASASATTTAIAGGATGEPTLPVTGSPVVLIVVLAGGLVASGLLLYVTTRRRKNKFVA